MSLLTPPRIKNLGCGTHAWPPIFLGRNIGVRAPRTQLKSGGRRHLNDRASWPITTIVNWLPLFSFEKTNHWFFPFAISKGREKIIKDFRHKAQSTLCSPATQANQAVFSHSKFLFWFLGLCVASNASETSSSCNLVSHVALSNATLTDVKKKENLKTPTF